MQPAKFNTCTRREFRACYKWRVEDLRVSLSAASGDLLATRGGLRVLLSIIYPLLIDESSKVLVMSLHESFNELNI
jgi:hypothetical protein